MKVTLDKSNLTIEGNKIVIEVENPAALEALLAGGKVPLSSLSPGETFAIGDETFIVLEHVGDETRVISEGFAYEDERFGESADWKASRIRTLLCGEYFDKLAAIVGAENILPLSRDLTSLDGLDDYGTCEDKVSLLTAAEYAKYHKILGLNSNYPDWWWTITPASAPSNGYERGVCCVGSDGILNWDGCGYCDGVRPFLNLKSSILVLAE